ncbi:hypothetical protein BEL04_11000 [Mucilaginibacter sp. PPCGB 2223]|uniref:YybH family protein n=1 Tax=Mucilaginibacter sp. PPCGB 2223 TaxID=1886027 RepID=UPI0008253047|nr:nuclear transport factor 2 family protein [Mucilaginibacter sp. PPCGB 2223]OCX52028.1 hypothetical protein BEL04_11000 [Mucilaginibacter sp. PPCGB 2223]
MQTIKNKILDKLRHSKKLNYLFITAFLLSTIILIIGCSAGKNYKIAKSRQEILKTEKDFEAAVKQEGMMAFAKFAAEDAVINRGDKLIKGKNAIAMYYGAGKTNSQLTWTAEFVAVSASGDLGYTYGNYTYTVKDPTGKTTDHTGIFHTVWKKQTDGKWKFVWD